MTEESIRKTIGRDGSTIRETARILRAYKLGQLGIGQTNNEENALESLVLLGYSNEVATAMVSITELLKG